MKTIRNAAAALLLLCTLAIAQVSLGTPPPREAPSVPTLTATAHHGHVTTSLTCPPYGYELDAEGGQEGASGNGGTPPVSAPVYKSSWPDIHGITHEVETVRKNGESKTNHAKRHAADVQALMDEFPPKPIVQTIGKLLRFERMQPQALRRAA